MLPDTPHYDKSDSCAVNMHPSALILIVPLLCVGPLVLGDRDNRTIKMELVQKHLRRLKKPTSFIRLVNGRGSYEGNVEVYHASKWGSICDDEWDQAEADVTCRQLGFEGALRPTHASQFGPARKRIWMDNLECDGSEKSITLCRFDGWGQHDCKENEGAGVVCNTPEAAINITSQLSDIEHVIPKVPIKQRLQPWRIRLRGGRMMQEGRVEILNNNTGEWGVICGDGWTLLEANVVCQELSLGFASDAPQTDFFGGNTSEIMASGVKCRGDETSLAHCLHHERTSCPGTKNNLASVICTPRMADLVLDHEEIMRTAHLEDRQMFFLQCAMEENCLASEAYEMQKQHPGSWHLETRRLLRFTLRALNAGNEVFKPFIPKHLWEWHACHMHYHSMEVFATFDVLDQSGKRVAEGHKASFCLEDNQCLPGVEKTFACANYGDQGISVNCSDIYKHNIDCQWVDISELDPGIYTFKVSINPEYKIGEMRFDNNAAVCNMHYRETFVYVHNCTLQAP